MSNTETLLDRLERLGLSLPIAFNFNDKKRLSATSTDDELLTEYKNIQASISSVQKANLRINHSNHKN